MKRFIRIILFFLVILSYIEQGKALLCWAQTAQSEYSGASLRDPFASQLPGPIIEVEGQTAAISQEESIQPPAIRVESQISGGPIPQAIINGKVLRAGDRVEGALIIKIDKEGVEALYQGRTFFFPAPSRKYAPTKRSKDE